MNGRAAWLLLAVTAAADAHRLDEYLQATRLAIDTARVEIEIDLTPGIAVASKVLGWIDTNGDGQVSRDEGQAYAREVLRSIVLKSDGSPVAITLTQADFPTLEEMNQGTGTIRLRATAGIPIAAPGRHQLSFLNMHRPELSVYLVNVLVPGNPQLKIGEQRRDVAQHGITVEYTVEGDARWGRTAALLLGCAMAGVLLLRYFRLRTST
jgi:hypothetical protein